MEKIKCMFMRAGTSRGPFIDLRDLPEDHTLRDQILLKIMGSPDKKQIDGLGGATPVTSKVVMVRPSQRAGIDLDYLFAQVFIDKPMVDTKPTCGNMMAGVAPFAIERGWIEPHRDKTKVMIYNLNTDSEIEAIIETPDGKINYTDGELSISGVPGKGAPVLMNLFGFTGGATGKLFPTGNRTDIVNEMEVSIVDAGNLMMHISAETLGLQGNEDHAFFNNNKVITQKIESTRILAGELCGLGDVRNSVLPKVGILSKPTVGGTIRSQYLTPFELHPSHAVSGAVCIATACKAEGTIAARISQVGKSTTEQIVVEHPSGTLPIQMEVSYKDDAFEPLKAGTLRTTRKIMDGEVFFDI